MECFRLAPFVHRLGVVRNSFLTTVCSIVRLSGLGFWLQAFAREVPMGLFGTTPREDERNQCNHKQLGWNARCSCCRKWCLHHVCAHCHVVICEECTAWPFAALGSLLSCRKPQCMKAVEESI